MLSLLLAEFLVLVHFAFILFVVFGGLLVLQRRWLVWMHLPAAIWGATVVALGWVCPLTPLENRLRIQAGQQGYDSDFISNYLLPLIYPADLNLKLQLVLAGFVVMINIVIYLFYFRRGGSHDATDRQ